MQYKVAERKMKAFMCADEQQQPHSPPARRSGQRSRSSSRRSSRSEARPPISALETCAERMAGVQGRAVDAQLAVADALASLKPTEQLVVALRHGWVDGTAELVMFKDVGTRMKRTLNGASNLYKKAESVLRARLEALGHADLELGQLRFSQQQREAWQRQLEGLPCKPSRRGAAGGSRPARSATGKAGGALEAAEPAELAAAGGGKAEQGVPQQQQAPEADPEPAASSSTRPPPGEGRQQAPAAEAGGPGPSTGTEAGSPSGQAAAAPAAAPSVLSNAAVAVPPSWQPRAEAAARLLSQWQLMVVRAAEPRALAVR
ncbi:expressed protein [Chlorella variabilis]|uniref:Expressed protein n=1 Tax=Chlorella variabilis TaxID=554065 RepID=E1Z7H4_CHLVA|nr:expressed protein [Chlorella variabilis]EFN57921.1 expressed protein [Chlorella variabilis]|eukprot:XP_005850023.1 expressed protein [Chlorella variabilis]